MTFATPALFVAAAVLGAVLVAGWLRADRRDRAAGQDPGDVPSGYPRRPPATPAQPRPRPAAAARGVAIGPPVVAGNCDDPLRVGSNDAVSLRDWLVHLHPHDRASWPDVVDRFCVGAARDPAVAGYFAAGGAGGLQKHFLTALILITGEGLTPDRLERLRSAHAAVRDTHGAAITGHVFDAGVEDLVQILGAAGVPGATLEQVSRILAVLRDSIVAPAGQPQRGAPARRWVALPSQRIERGMHRATRRPWRGPTTPSTPRLPAAPALPRSHQDRNHA